MKLDIHLVLRRFCSGLVEVEYQPAPRELEPIPVFKPVEKGPRLLPGVVLDQAIPESSFQVEIEQSGKFPRLEQPIRTIGSRSLRIEMPLNGAFALVDLLGDAFLELTVATETKALGTALHFDEIARDGTLCQIEVEQGQIGPVQRHLVAHLFRLALHGPEQIDAHRTEIRHFLSGETGPRTYRITTAIFATFNVSGSGLPARPWSSAHRTERRSYGSRASCPPENIEPVR